MSESRSVVRGRDTEMESQVELVKDIKKNIASLKISVDSILHDMDSIRDTKLEILERLDMVKNVNTSEQIRVTLDKAKRIMKKSDENRLKLDLMLKKISKINFINDLAEPDNSNVINGNGKDENADKDKYILRRLDNNRFMLTVVESNNNNEEVGKEKTCKRARDSALKELQWIVKMKLYKLRHHYDRLSYDQDLEEGMPLPVCRGRPVGEQA